MVTTTQQIHLSSFTIPQIFFSSHQDGSGPQLPSAYEPEPLAKYGTLDVAFEYDSSEQYLAVTVTAATDIPALKQTGNIAWQVHLVLLPTKKQRAKTGVQKGPCPVFTETFKFSRVEQEALGDYAVRFRLYSIRRMKKEKVLGEKVFYLTKLNLQGKIALPVTLEPGSELTVRTPCEYISALCIVFSEAEGYEHINCRCVSLLDLSINLYIVLVSEAIKLWKIPMVIVQSLR